MNRLKKYILLISLLLIAFTGFSQNWFAGAEWNFHTRRDVIVPFKYEYIHLGTTKTTGDTLIDSKLFSILKTDSIHQDYLYQENGMVYYWKQGEILRLFDFSKYQDDSFQIDLNCINVNHRDTIVKDVWVRIDSIWTTVGDTYKDTFRTFSYSLLSQNIKDAYGPGAPFPLPYPVAEPMLEKMIRIRLSSYSTMQMTVLFDPFINMGMDSKPMVTCYRNSNLDKSYTEWAIEILGLPCDLYNGIHNIKPLTGIKLYPNPVTDHFFTLHYPDGVSESKAKISIRDLLGKIIRQEMISIENKKSQVRIPEIGSGIYFIEIEWADRKQTIKISF
ncbi:MAG: T9SS type A sorting domain-containing protein [Bacteroidia bacterium]|jgi:hypothetical protein